MIQALRHRLLLAALLLAVGCSGAGEKEAQLEFERLRRRPNLPQGDRLLPSFDPDSSSDDARQFTHLSRGPVRQP
jgi:hypothetical protein